MHPRPSRAFSLIWARCHTVVPRPRTARESTSAVCCTCGIVTMVLRFPAHGQHLARPHGRKTIPPGSGMRAAVADVRKPRQTAGRQLPVGEKEVTSDPTEPPRMPNQGNKWWTRLAQMREASGRARRQLQLIVLGVCLCLAIIGVSVAALSSPGAKSG